MANKELEMIFCIVNAGFSGEVMNVAREEGATGGTIMHARGTANPDAEKKFGITINPEKDIVMLIVDKKVKDNILKSVYKKIGLGTDAKGIAFSLPVADAVGIK